MADPAALDALARLLDVMARLRAPGGCPWDREQTPESLRRFVLEEAYEVLDAIDHGDAETLAGELGDLLLQVVFQSEIAAERGAFSMVDVAGAIVDKLERRHPHVFGSATVADANDVVRKWGHQKDAEQGVSDVEGVAAAVPRAMPALARSQKIASKLARRGFAWPDARGILEKMHEELRELTEALGSGHREAIERELGDLLLAVASLAAALDVPAELALRDALDRFVTRAGRAEALAAERGQSFATLDEPEREALWQVAKRRS